MNDVKTKETINIEDMIYVSENDIYSIDEIDVNKIVRLGRQPIERNGD